MQGDLISYYQNLILTIFRNINYTGFVSALLIMVTWFIFMNRIDIFEKEKIRYSILAVFLGMLFSFFTFIISDSLGLFYEFRFIGNLFHDLFITSFLSIGTVEELVKLIPFLLILKFTREVNEPFDFIFYACMSALGFAFIENLGYFAIFNGNILPGRAFMSVVAHMIFSSVSIYGLVLAKFRFNSSGTKFFVLSFLAAAFLHGLYDYLIYSHSPILFLVYFIFILQCWAIIMNNTINNSKFFDFKIAFQAQKLRLFLAMMLTLIIIISFLINILELGKEKANENFYSNAIFSGFFLIFYITSLSNYDLVKGYWRPISIRFSAPNQNQLPSNRGFGSLLSFFKYNYIIPLNLVHYKIHFRPPHYNTLLHGIFGNVAGEITDRVCLYTIDKNNDKELIETDWFLVKVEEELPIQPYLDTKCICSHILIKLENKTDSILHDTDVRCYIRLIPELKVLYAPKALKQDFAFAGFVLANGASIPANAY